MRETTVPTCFPSSISCFHTPTSVQVCSSSRCPRGSEDCEAINTKEGLSISMITCRRSRQAKSKSKSSLVCDEECTSVLFTVTSIRTYSESSLFRFLLPFLLSIDGEGLFESRAEWPELDVESSAARAAASARTWLRAVDSFSS
jgi:hypothetical protein